MKDIRLEKLANLIINYSAKVQPEDDVFIICDEAASPFMIEAAKAAVIAGGLVETILNNQEVAETKLKYGSHKQIAQKNFLMEAIVNKADVLITAWGGRNTKINANIDAEKMKSKALSDRAWRKIFSKRMGDGSLRWTGTQFPTHSDAQEANMSLSDYEAFVYGAGLLDTEDPAAEWEKISASQEQWVQYLDRKKELHILSEDTDLKVCIDGRKWQNCDGRLNFPDGEVYTSPVDDKINGVISFSFPGIYAGKEIEGIKMEIVDGLVKTATAKKGEDLLKALLSTDEGSNRFGEVAIGTNYGIQKFTRNMLFDEKIGGTIHMALGNSMPEAGGVNQSAIHWDMLCDMRKGGQIFADGELFHENGIFLDAVLNK